MHRWLSAFTLAVCLATTGSADAQVFNKKKPKTTTQTTGASATDVPVPGQSPYTKYTWRDVYTCDAKWFEDGALRSCGGIAGTNRTRLEDNGNFAEHVYWDPGQEKVDRIELVGPKVLLVQAKGKVRVVSLPSGKQTQTNFDNWIGLSGWGDAGAVRYLMAPAEADGRSPLAPVSAEGAVGRLVPGADLARWAQARENCSVAAATAALIPENTLDTIAGKPWSELRRRTVVNGAVGPADLSAAGDVATRCTRYRSHFFVGKRAADGGWSVIHHNGKVVSSAAYPTPEAAEAAAPALLDDYTALVAKNEVDAEASRILLAKAEADRVVAAAAASQKFAAEMEVRHAAAVAEARAAAQPLLKAGQYEQAVKAAEPLDAAEWATYVLAWRAAPVSLYQRAIDQLNSDPGRGQTGAAAARQELERRRNAINSCMASYGPLPGPGGADTRWNRTPPTQRALEMNAMRSQINSTQYSGSGMNLAFDATAYQWVWVSYGAGGVINVPPNTPPQPVDAAALDRCDRQARGLN